MKLKENPISILDRIQELECFERKGHTGVKNAMISTPETLSFSSSFILSTSPKAFPGLGFDIK